MSKAVSQLALPLETHRNHFLFSDYYLNEVLPRQAVWRKTGDGAKEALKAITELYHRQADALSHLNEAQTEEHWIRPVLNILGHVYEVQPSLPGVLGVPDYAFFADQETRQAAATAPGKAPYWETVLAVGDAKRWGRPLDKRIVNGAPDAFTNANPCYQIDYYLRRTGRAWGIVSNGRQWRLYHCDTSFRLDVFYEVDLVQLIEQGEPDAFCYFYLFFRAAAFHPDAEGHVLSETKGRCWLDEVLAQSTAYAVRVGDELKGRVYEALRLLAQGFLDYSSPGPQRGPSPQAGELDLPRVHNACLILLYRLLFLLYAESRGLLPLNNRTYAGQYSLKAIKEDIARKLDRGVVYLAQRATIWDDLRTLFDIIYGGQAALGVPAYDGGLFDPARHPFLEGHTIGDRYLAGAIDLLARAEAGSGRGLSFVDYRDLSIRHLGNIYEGLLEYRLAYAAKEVVVVKCGKGKEIVKTSEVSGKVVERIPAGQVYLITDRGERKATGSYYTPDYIVKYIVEQTLGPLADAQAEAVEREIAALKAENKGAARRTRAYKDELARRQNSFADRALALNVLDPAMGSGHFLVEATDYLARRIVESGAVTEALANGDEASELGYWRRRVVERCIYGVDLNPLAVELAKLSLWLATVARGKPLSFLDHHLRCGNSLIGARVADLQALPTRKGRKARRPKPPEGSKPSGGSQLRLWDESAFTQDMFLVVGAMRQIQDYETADLVSVKEKERLFSETVERERRKWRAVANLWTATYFGLELTPELYTACANYVRGKPVLLGAAQAEATLARAREIWQHKRFFHWEIEFPEVFFDEYGRHKGDAAGFDAVVGNPPYHVTLDADERQFLNSEANHSGNGRLDTAALFVELGLVVLRGWIGFLLPYRLISRRRDFGNFQRFLYQNARICEVDYLGPVEEIDANDEFMLLILSGSAAGNEVVGDNMVRVGLDIRREAFEQETLLQQQHTLKQKVWGPPGYVFNIRLALFDQDILAKMEAASVKLGEIAESRDGIVPFIRDKLVSDEPKDHRYKRLLGISGCYRLDRYQAEWDGTWICYDFDEAKKHISDPQELRKVQLRDEGIFLKPQKIITCQNSTTLRGTIDESQFYHTNSIHSTYLTDAGSPYSLHYILALLNSRGLNYYHSSLSLKGPDLHPQILVTNIPRLPIRRISFTTPPGERARLVGDGITEATEWIETSESASVPFSAFSDSKLGRWLDARLSAKPEQADAVHDLLAHLAEQMIQMNEAKQAEARGFLSWLAEYTGRPVDEWALKTSLRRYYRHDWAEMQRVLERNRRKLPRVNLDVEAYKNEPAAKIRAAWETSMGTLRPLLARIAATDRLIDRIVYRLYELTDEEIAVVEGVKI